MDTNKHKLKITDCCDNVRPDLIRHLGRIFSIVLVGLCIILLNGCIIPYPHFKETCGPLYGQVIAENSNIPVENALVKVSYPDGGHRKTYTDLSGYFSFPEKNRFHWGILFAVALNHSLPFDDYRNGFTSLEIAADGYDECTVYPEYFKNTMDHLANPSDLYMNLENPARPQFPLSKRAN